jgi:LPPG:FO 2-phospho-L-lactate transferase
MTGAVVALCGGIGGAKLALGLSRLLSADLRSPSHDHGPPAGELTVVVNTGDDFEHLGLSISPDIDTVLYTLGGLADRERGWGRSGETWQFMDALRELGGEAWFQLGDRDLAMHVERTRWLRQGETLDTFVAHAARAFGITARILPMTNDRVQTMVQTNEGVLPFQRYFVERRCAPVVRALRFEGAGRSTPAGGVLAALLNPEASAIVICPSNPFLSIDPILAIPGIREALTNATARVVAVSPIIAGQAVKGPTVKIMRELGIAANTSAIAAHYRGLIDGLVLDEADSDEAADVDVPVLSTRTLMIDLEDRERLARDVLAFAGTLAGNSSLSGGSRGADGRGLKPIAIGMPQTMSP